MKKNGKAREFPLKGDGTSRSANLYPLMEYIGDDNGRNKGADDLFDNFMSGKLKLKKKAVKKSKTRKNTK